MTRRPDGDPGRILDLPVGYLAWYEADVPIPAGWRRFGTERKLGLTVDGREVMGSLIQYTGRDADAPT